VSEADVVQLEWWNHPATIACLCEMRVQPIRLVVWCHISGLHDPIIPQKLIEASHRFILTSACSLNAPGVADVATHVGSRLSVVSSGSVPADSVLRRRNGSREMSVGYIGSLNFSKLHPDYVEFLAAVSDSEEFQVRIIGETLNRSVLETRCREMGRPGLLQFTGYVTDVAKELDSIDTLAYLLNPLHYGTAENALLEAMATGIVPIVLNNAAEKEIVSHARTGLIVSSIGEFGEAIQWLRRNPEQRVQMGARASDEVRQRYCSRTMEASLRAKYREAMSEEKKPIAFPRIFGSTPDAWFLSCRSNPEAFDQNIRSMAQSPARFAMLERSKGSIFHFLQYFPHCERLRGWASRMGDLECA
jgi:glycosyltransferase involved in cell wall biosynthesis